MKPIDIRNQNWQGIIEQLNELRSLVFTAWQMHGPGTTREVCERGKIDILTFRPRTTELYQAGLLALVDRSGDRNAEGVYRVRNPEEWEQWKSKQLPASGQLELV